MFLFTHTTLFVFGTGCTADVEEPSQQIQQKTTQSQQPINPHLQKQPLPPLNPVGTGVFTQETPDKKSDPQKNALCPSCNVVLVTFCSLRKDHVSLYDSQFQITPELEKIGKKGQYFSQAYSASNFTLASLTSILTGRFGSSTGVTGWDKGLVKDIPTLPEILGFYGYETAGFTIDSASGFRPDYGLDRGFQHLQIDRAPPKTPDGRSIFGEYVTGAAAIPAVTWLKKRLQTKSEAPEQTQKPFFMMFLMWIFIIFK